MRMIAFRRQLAARSPFNDAKGYTRCDVCGNRVDELATCDGCRCQESCGDDCCDDRRTCTAATPTSVLKALASIE